VVTVPDTSTTSAPTVVLNAEGLQALVDALATAGYTVLGPTVRDGVIVPGPISSVNNLPQGWGDVQDGGHYRLRRWEDNSFFGYAADAVSWKAVLFPARELIWSGTHHDEGFTTEGAEATDANTKGHYGEPPYALLGVRSCDVHALAIHDRILRDRAYADTRYSNRRADAFVVTVTCAAPSGTCFCVSMETGPQAESGFDLAITELLGERHCFVVTVGSERGAAVLSGLPGEPVTTGQLAEADQVAAEATAQMGRQLDTFDLRNLLYANVEHARWDDVADRCLSCGNCTMVCPTCFCTAVEDHTSLAGQETERWRIWDSCHTTDYSYLHGGSLRATPRSRYRQWLTHKLASWNDQFGTSGCVGCGRCIAWCPVGIDITEEVAAIRANPAAGFDDSRGGQS
jgi:sulfhydrogenase subunit beta (sulfur reductase)